MKEEEKEKMIEKTNKKKQKKTKKDRITEIQKERSIFRCVV